jgi:hypothetical protein
VLSGSRNQYERDAGTGNIEAKTAETRDVGNRAEAEMIVEEARARVG